MVVVVVATSFWNPNQPGLSCLNAAVQVVDIAYRLDVNAWRGEERVQLVVEHLVPHP